MLKTENGQSILVGGYYLERYNMYIYSKPTLAKASRLGKGSITLEGGKNVNVKKKEGIGPRPLDRWLLAGYDRTVGSGVEANLKEEPQGGLGPQGGQKK